MVQRGNATPNEKKSPVGLEPTIGLSLNVINGIQQKNSPMGLEPTLDLLLNVINGNKKKKSSVGLEPTLDRQLPSQQHDSIIEPTEHRGQ